MKFKRHLTTLSSSWGFHCVRLVTVLPYVVPGGSALSNSPVGNDRQKYQHYTHTMWPKPSLTRDVRQEGAKWVFDLPRVELSVGLL